MKKTIVARPDGEIIAIHDPMQGVTRHDYADFGLTYVGTLDDRAFKRGDETGYVWADQSGVLEVMKVLAIDTLDADDLASDDAKAAIGKAKKLSTLMAAVEQAIG